MTAPSPGVDVEVTASLLRDARARIFVAATGAGAGIQEILWRVPGCSRFLVGAVFPYAAEETDALLGFAPERYASERTAVELASAAYLRALDPLDEGVGAIGLGLTASVATTRIHRGDHRVHVAVMTRDRVAGTTVTLPKGEGSQRRREDGVIADTAALQALFDAVGLVRHGHLEDWSTAARTAFFARPYWDPSGRRHGVDALPLTAPLFPGTFDPPHAGHLALASTERGHAHPAVFAICATPPHKGAMTVQEGLRRARLLAGQHRLFTEGDPLYLDKARRFPGRTFLLGADALERMLEPAWGTPADAMLDELARLGASFRVNARVVRGAPLSLADLEPRIPARHRAMFHAVEGRWDLSSTELRRGLRAQARSKSR